MNNILSLIGLALAPSIYLAIIIYGKDKIHREPKKILLIAFILGGLSTIPPHFVPYQFFSRMDIFSCIESDDHKQLLDSFLGVALIEEFLKFIIVRFYAYKQEAFKEPFDGIVCTVFVALGFATVESIYYIFWRSGSNELGEAATRFIVVPLHYLCAVIMGYYIGKAKFEPRYKTLHLVKALGFAILIHGAYDYFWESDHGDKYTPFQSSTDLFPISYIAIGIVIIGLLISKRAINQLESESVFLLKKKNNIE